LGDGLTVYGNLVVAGTQLDPVIFTSGQTDPVKGARGYSNTDWDGIEINEGGSLSMTYAIIEYADKGVSFNGYSTSVSGNITNSLFEYTGVGIGIYGGANNVIAISNNLFRYNGTAFDITSGTPVIKPGNIITQNDTGINVRSQSGLIPFPVITGNKIFDNNIYNINSTLAVDAQGNYWGSDVPAEIASKINGSGIDFSNFILTASAPLDPDVPASTNSSAPTNALQACPIVRVTDDTNYVDTYPDENIDWIGSNYTEVAEIEKAFNNARAIDGTVFQYLKMPSQEDWDAMSVQQQGLYLINSERQARGIKPYEGVSPNIVTVAKNYADFTRSANLLAYHFNDGKTPTTI